MTLLEEFIFSLSKPERSKLRPLQFRGPKRSIFFKIMECKLRSGIDSDIIISRFKLTKKRYYQILSDMLSACYNDLVPEGGTKLLAFLGSKQLFRHLYNEMRKQEAELQAAHDEEVLTGYYFQVLLQRNLFLIHRGLHADLMSELDEYAVRYVRIKKPHPHDALYLRILKINKESEKPFKGLNLETTRSTIAELDSILAQVKKGDHLLAQFIANDTLLIMSTRLLHPNNSPSVYAKYGLQLLEKHKTVFGSYKALYQLEYFQYLSAKEGNTTAMVKERLLELSNHLGCSFYHLGMFITRLVRSGEAVWAKGFIAKQFSYNVDLLRSDIALHYWYTLTILNVYLDDYDEGLSCLQKAFQANTGRNRDINSDVILRCYEVFFIAMQGDPIALETATSRQLRYFQHHGYKRSETYHSTFLKAVFNLTKTIGYDRAKALKIQQEFLQAPGINRVSVLFEKIFNKYFA